MVKRFIIKVKDPDHRCEVYLYDALDEMRAAIKRHCGDENVAGFAFTLCGNGDMPRVYFAREGLTLDFVSHEFTHVAYEATLDLSGGRPRRKHHEFIATLQGELVRAFWARAMNLPDDVCVLANEKLFNKEFKAAGRMQEVTQ